MDIADDGIITSIDEWAEKSPDSICFKAENEKHSYKELKSSSDSLAAFLSAEYENNKPIIVYGGLEFEMIVCFLACVKSGHAYIPMDHSTPKSRADHIAETSEADCVLAVGDCALDNGKYEIIGSDIIKAECGKAKKIDSGKFVSGDDNYYIIFTSGTTSGPKAIPKGVQISHNNLYGFVRWILSDFNIRAGGSFLVQAPFSFDLSVMSLYPALVSGGTLIPIPKSVTDDFVLLFKLLPTLDINTWVSTPSFADICLLEPTFDQDHMKSLTHFLFCGEEFEPHTAIKLLNKFPRAEIYNLYGPTETTVAVTEMLITRDVVQRYDRIPIGHVKSDSEIFVLDNDGKTVQKGEEGEIVIRGPCVSRGYINNPEKTREAFIEYGGEKAYKTGDAGSYDDDGILQFKGRIDFQVKVNGYRIELEDVDNYLMQTPLVEEAAVVPKYSNNKVKYLVAYVVANSNADDEFELTKTIKADMGKIALGYMIPKVFIYVDQLPLSANEKVDRKALVKEVNS